MICPMCGKPIEGSPSDILPGRDLCKACARQIRRFAHAEDDDLRRSACDYLRHCRTTTQDADVREAIDTLLAQYGADLTAEASAAPAALTMPDASAASVSTPKDAPRQDVSLGNAGSQIIAAADVLCALGAIASAILGIFLFGIGMDKYDGKSYIIAGFAVILLGSLVSWFFSLLLRGFGEMVNNISTQTELAIKHAASKE